jgi:hypothetical protein
VQENHTLASSPRAKVLQIEVKVLTREIRDKLRRLGKWIRGRIEEIKCRVNAVAESGEN